MTEGGPLIYVIAGEPSGDSLGASLMAALKRKTGGGCQFAGIGGPMMISEGLEPLFPMTELTVMGLAEVVPKIPKLLRRIKETAEDAAARRPAAVVTIDAPDFSFRVAKRLQPFRGQMPLVHYVAPTVWAWRPGRARKVARLLDHLLCLLPFEPAYFEREGLGATFVGHPIVGAGKLLPVGARVPGCLAVLPGSRSGEVARLMPVFGETVRRLAEAGIISRAVIPAVPNLENVIRAEARTWPVPIDVVVGEEAKARAFARAEAALAASGTVTLELARAGVPTVLAYRVNALSAAIARRMIRVDHVGLVNLLLERRVMPEFLQEACTADNLIGALTPFLTDPGAAEAQRRAYKDALQRLAPEGGGTPSERAAAAVLDVVRRAPA